MSPPTTRLSIEGLTSGYGTVTVLRDVSIAVADAEIVAILGANGAGKSTLLKTVVGLVRSSGGRITVGGTAITGFSTEAIARAGVVLVPEGRQLFAAMTVRENLLLGAYIHGRSGRERRLGWVLDIFPALAELLGRRAANLSGGQQQMVAIGRGLMARPDLLLLDEPSLGLAPLMIQETFRTLQRLRNEGVTVLLVEQNASMTLEFADRVYVLERGRVAIEGDAAELRNDPRIQAAYLGLAVDTVDHGLERAPGRRGLPEEPVERP